MNESKPKKYRYWLTHLLRDLPAGAEFSPGELHITVIPWFVVEPEVELELNKSFIENFSGQAPFEVSIGGEVSLGPRQDISVFLLEDSQEITQLHNQAVEWFEKLNARWAVKHPYAKDEYIPHIRRREGNLLRPGDKVNFNSLSLVRALRRADEVREVAAKAVFNG